MKKSIFGVFIFALTCLIFSTTVVAMTHSSVLVSEEIVELTIENPRTRMAEVGELTLRTYDQGGVTVFVFDVNDGRFQEAAHAHIMGLTGDPTYGGTVPLPRLRSGHLSARGQDGRNALSYAWKNNTINNTFTGMPQYSNFTGGHSAGWNGQHYGLGNADSLRLSTTIFINTLGPSISIPPSFSLVGGNTFRWDSFTETRFNNIGTSLPPFSVSNLATSVEFIEVGHIVHRGREWRPTTSIRYGLFTVGVN